MNVVVVAPHPDDESIGCGGILSQYAERRDRVVVVFLTSGELALKHLPKEQAWRIREAEAEAAAEVLGVARVEFVRAADWFLSDRLEDAVGPLRATLERENPHLVLLPHPLDAHPDHRAAHDVYRRAIEPMDGSAPPAVQGYEVWTPIGQYEYLVDVTPQMARKLRAVRCYTSQLEQFRYDQAVRGLNRYRGALQSSCRYAEVYQELTGAFVARRPALVADERQQ